MTKSFSCPPEVATSHTLAFFLPFLVPGSRVLEVGSGKGELAFQLAQQGFEVFALDSSTKALAQAARPGVQTVHATWPDFKGDPFDAIFFTRSLHHIPPLKRSLELAHALLKPEGRILVEDFAFHDVQPTCASWFYWQLQLLKDLGALLDVDTFGRKVIDSQGALAPWKTDHIHHLHRADLMARELMLHFQLLEQQHAPYLYRYLIQMLPETPEAARLASQFLQLETLMGDLETSLLIGRRWVCQKRELDSKKHSDVSMEP